MEDDGATGARRSLGMKAHCSSTANRSERERDGGVPEEGRYEKHLGEGQPRP
jgi:hypothetical protein